MSKRINDLLPTDLIQNFYLAECELEIPEWAFYPDQWSIAFLRGLRKAELDATSIWEVGMGTGLNLIFLKYWFPDAKLRYSDFDARAPLVAHQNLARFHVTGTPHWGSWDLVDPVDEEDITPPKVDAVVACIPQVPAEFDLSQGDNFAHYYDPTRYREAHLHAFGLGLNEALLTRAKNVLRPSGRIILNLGGRPGLNRLLQMFTDAGYLPRVLHHEVIQQHAGTSLETLASLEVGSHTDFEFFTDVTATQPINAREAEERRISGAPLFHKIYVIEGTLP